MSEPLAYFLTWTTYGTWLPGDQRGWVRHRDGAWHVPIRDGDRRIAEASGKLMPDDPTMLTEPQRHVVRRTIVECCRLREWTLHGVNVRSNHVHVVVVAAGRVPEQVMGYFKSWATRSLNATFAPRPGGPWWTRHGSTRYINTAESLRKAIEYVENQ
jgi:REP element-mobilizing transposase RayT